MKKIIFTLISILSFTQVFAQGNFPMGGVPYCLPKTAIKLTILIEKSTYTPGELVAYADKYMKLTDISEEKSTVYKILTINATSIGVPDSSKTFSVLNDKKHNITEVVRDESGILLAINAKPKQKNVLSHFIPAPKKKPLNAKDYMNEDILSAGSAAKMAELIARDIYEIRDSRNQLSRGQAESMPKDGEQLKLMLNNLNLQEKALLQVFSGETNKDTSEVILTFIPDKEIKKEIIFRFSKHYGLVDKDDLSGTPYYINIENLKSIANTNIAFEGIKGKDNAGVYVTLPSKARLTINQDKHTLLNMELYLAQFGRTEALSGELFNKKTLTKLVLNPITGNIENITTENIK